MALLLFYLKNFFLGLSSIYRGIAHGSFGVELKLNCLSICSMEQMDVCWMVFIA